MPAALQTQARKRRGRRPLGRAWVALTILQLLCDTAQDGLARAAEPEPSSDSDANLSTANVRPARAQWDERPGDARNRQRFLKEPEDVFAVVGQPEVALSCAVLAKRGLLAWKSSDLHLLTTDSLVMEMRDQLRLTLDRYSRAAEGPAEPAGAPDDDEVSNYTLHIRNVKLENDNLYQCTVNFHDETHLRISSRKARLSVLQPPRELELRLARVDSDNGTSADFAGMSPADTPLRPADDQQPGATRVLELEENDRVRLECAAGASKPRAEIVWLDADTGQPLDEAAEQAPLVETRVEVEPAASEKRPPLERTVSALTLRADRRLHHNKLLACQTDHRAYALEPAAGAPALEPLRQTVRLSVLYKPQVRLTKDQAQPAEFQPIKFTCLAEARPAALNFSWFIDDQPLEGAHGSELSIARLTRQLHMREIKCRATNALGAGSALMRLAVKYAPAYVTHLLPASLQPDHLVVAGAQPPVAGGRERAQAAQRELALAGLEKENATLRCDFDSNPSASLRVQWFKLTADYVTMKDVQPDEAGALIAGGAAGAVYRREPADERAHRRAGQARRHIQAQAQGAEPAELPAGHVDERGELNFELMSSDLLQELRDRQRDQDRLDQLAEALRARNESLEQVWPRGERVLLVEEIREGASLSQSTPKIFEPLAFAVRQRAGPPANASAQAEAARDTHAARASQLVLRRRPLDTGANETAPLTERHAQLSSSSLRLTNVNSESVGKYVCVARAADGAALAKPVFFVLKQSPRIISARRQWAPLGAGSLSVQCLAQTSAVLDDQTDIQWFRDGKPIDHRNGSQRTPAKFVAVEREFSPDGLFVRSVLTIGNADFADFGPYNCSVGNSRGRDSMVILLQPAAPTGFTFTLLAAVALGCVFLFVAGVCVLLVLARGRPARVLKAKSVIVTADGKARLAAEPAPRPAGRPGSPSSQSGQSDAKRSISSSDASAATRQLDAPPPHPDSLGKHLSRPESALGTFGFDAADSQRARFARASLRSESNYQSPNSARLHQLNQARFAAIHETLEHKLHFSAVGGPADLAAYSTRADLQQAAGRVDSLATFGETAGHEPAAGADSSRPARTGLIDKIRNKLMPVAPNGSYKTNGILRNKQASLGRTRPTISMPVGGVVGGSGGNRVRRSSLTGSLTLVGGGCAAQASSPTGAQLKHSMMMHLNPIGDGVKSNLVSSSANLIQDSGTASDGTSSSGRSSSAGHGHRLQQMGQQVFSGPAAANHPQLLYQWSPQQAQMAPTNCDNILYANSANLYDIASDQQQQQQLYANGYPRTVAPDPIALAGAYGQFPSKQHIVYASSQPDTQYQQQEQLLAANEHYQMPAMMSEPYLAAAVAAVQQQRDRPCYTANCNEVNNNLSLNHSPQMLQNGHSMNGNGYGTLPARNNLGPEQQQQAFAVMSSSTGSPTSIQANHHFGHHQPDQHQPAFMVPTSDGADAYFESNYGTLLSRSSAYKTLGYNQSQQPANNLCAGSSNSSSPNSLTTHANMSNTTLNAGQQHQRLLHNGSNLSTSHQANHHQHHHQHNHHQLHHYHQQHHHQQQAFPQPAEQHFNQLDSNKVHFVVADQEQPGANSDDQSKMDEMTDMNNDASPRASPTSHMVNGLTQKVTRCDKQHQQLKATAVIQSNGSTTTTNIISGHDGGDGGRETPVKDGLATHV